MEMLEVLPNSSVRIKNTMKKHMLNHIKESSPKISEIRLSTLTPKGTKSGYNGFFYITVNGQMIFGLHVASKVCKIICDVGTW